MNEPIDARRRRLLQYSGLGLLTLSGFTGWLRAMESEAMPSLPKMAPNRASPGFKPDVEIELSCRPGSLSILPGAATRVQQYAAHLIKGPENTLTNLPASYLGPVMRLQKGQKIRIHLRNELDEPTITHWHGLHVPASMDGHPRYAVDQGETFVYEFEVLNRAGLYLYHPHPHGATASQVYHGLAGAILVNDEEERALDLPSGEYEIPIVIQDRSFDEHNQLRYLRGMHDRMLGFYGDRILVNGRPDFRIDVATRAYRLRFMNGSTARIYKLAWDDGTPVTVLGVDGGLLEKPVNKPYVMLAPGERLDVWADFSGRGVGSRLAMRSRSFSGVLPRMGGHGMGGAMMAENELPVGSDYPIFTAHVIRKVGASPALPTRLCKIARYQTEDAANPKQPVPIGISEGPMAMLLNGRAYAYDDVQPNERIPFDTLQLIEIFRPEGAGHSGDGERRDQQPAMAGMGMGRGMRGTGMMGGMRMGGATGMMMSMAHPIHMHGQAFQIISRTIHEAHTEAYASVRDGFIDHGWKDTVLVMPGERVRLIKPFRDYKGIFMVHCHNLEHEDAGMMRDFHIV